MIVQQWVHVWFLSVPLPLQVGSSGFSGFSFHVTSHNAKTRLDVSLVSGSGLFQGYYKEVLILSLFITMLL